LFQGCFKVNDLRGYNLPISNPAWKQLLYNNRFYDVCNRREPDHVGETPKHQGAVVLEQSAHVLIASFDHFAVAAKLYNSKIEGCSKVVVGSIDQNQPNDHKL
jgi:hypothetical protein